MCKKSIAIISLAAMLFTARSLGAVEGSGGQGGAFLRVPIGARPASMGNAFVAMADDANALYFNPGGLYQIKRFTLGVTYSLMTMDRNHYQGSFIYSDKTLGSFGLMFTGFEISDIDARDSQGNPDGKFDDSEIAFSLGYGRKLLTFLGVGGSFKYLNHCLKGNKATGFGFDIGAHSKIEIQNSFLNSIRLGMSASNLGAKLKWDTGSSHEDEIPSTFRFGSGFNFKFDKIEILVALDGSQTSDESFKFHSGAETWFYNTFALQAGLDGGHFNFGASLKLDRFRFDYAFCPDELEEGATSKIGIQVEF
jgi:hypothetical protein